MAYTGPTTAPLPQYSWLEPSVPGALLALGEPATKPRWLDPGDQGTVLTIAPNGLPTWMVPPPVTGIPTTVLQNKGDLISATGPLTTARVASGPDRYVLVSDSTKPAGLAWESRPTDVLYEGATAPTDPTIELWLNPAEDPSSTGGMTNPMSSLGDLIVGSTGGFPSRLGASTDGKVLTLAGGVPVWSGGLLNNPMVAQADLLVGGVSGAPSRLGVGANTQVLTVVGGALAWAAPLSGGMTNPMSGVGDLIVGASGGSAVRLAAGAATQVLTMVGGSPAWQAPVSGGMTNPMVAVGDIIIGSTGGSAVRLAAATNAQVLTLVSGSPAWATSLVSSVFTRTGAIVATAGDYTAAQVTNAADTTAANVFAHATGQTMKKLLLSGATSGTLTVQSPAVAGANTITLPAGTTDFSATGGASQVVRQSTVGGAFTVSALTAADVGAMNNPMSAPGDLVMGGSLGVPTRVAIGTAAQVLTVVGGFPAWSTAPMSNPLTTAGDLVVAGNFGTPGRLGIGTETYVLTVVSGVPAWSAPTGGGGGVSGLTSGSVLFGSATGGIAEDHANFAWDAANHNLLLFGATAAGTSGNQVVVLNWCNSPPTSVSSAASIQIFGGFGGFLGNPLLSILDQNNIMTVIGGGGIGASAAGAGPLDTFLLREAPYTWAIRNSTAANTLRIYTWYAAGGTNYSRASLGWASNVFTIGTEQGGGVAVSPLALSGSALEFRIANVAKWTVNSSGNWLPSVSNVNDTGSATNRVQSLYLGKSVNFIASTPTTPSSGQTLLYVKSDKKLYQMDDTGLETALGGGGGFSNPLTTLGDIFVGAASGTPSRLGIGSTNQVLTVVGGVPAWATTTTAPVTSVFTRTGAVVAQTGDYTVAQITGALSNPMTTSQDLIVGGSAGAPTRLGKGADTQVLTVVSGALAWATPTALSNPMTTLGDVITGQASGVPGRLGIGSTNQVLTVVSGVPAWAAPSGGVTGLTTGSVLFGSATGTVAEDNANFFWDDTANHLRLGAGASLGLYNLYTSPTVYERLNFSVVSNVYIIASETVGGTARDISIRGSGSGGGLKFGVGAADKWNVTPGGHFLPLTTNVLNLGATTNRILGLYMSGTLDLTGRLVVSQNTVTYSASMTMDAALGHDFIITATNATAFTINAPSNPVTGQRITVRVRNTTAGALGAATWNAVFKMAAWTQPATVTSRSITFLYDGTNWVEISRTPADVPT